MGSDVLVFGAGFLGTRLARELGAALSTADIADPAAVAAALDTARPWAVINAVGRTGRPNVDWCEANPAPTIRSNVTGAIVLAEACAARGCHLLHLGSGCVYYGDSPSPGGWSEDDFGNPVSFYSRTKYAADLLLSGLPDVSIVRLRMPIDDAPHERNLVTRLARYTQVVDATNSVTVVADLVAVVRGLLERRATGIFHATNPGPIRHAEILAWYREFVDPAHHAELIAEAELLGRGLVAKQRSACILASPRLDALGLRMRPAREAVRDAIRRYGQALEREALTS